MPSFPESCIRLRQYMQDLAENPTGLLHALRGFDDLPQMTTRTFIGILVAITGNILISLALNLQKLAHKRVENMKRACNEEQSGLTLDESDEHEDLVQPERDQEIEDVFSATSSVANAELQPLTANPDPIIRDYGTESLGTSPGQSQRKHHSFLLRFSPSRVRSRTTRGKFMLPADIMTEDAALHGFPSGNIPQDAQDGSDAVEENEGEYLKSKLWWMGFLLMNVGEMGNFISYAFAPASVVAPLGTFALIANCFFAPLLLGEHFRKRDLLGVAIAIIGAVTVVLASNASDTRLDPDGLLQAISQTSFIVYSCIYVGGALILATLSEGRIGKTWVFVDIGLCALFGGFTVLSTKALSTLLTLQWIEIFTNWITYPLIAVLVLTGVGQIRYLNRALMRFDSKVVIPVQFVLFTLSAIVGSAILYGDFQKANFHQIVTFLYGCAATFVGVFTIAWTPADSRTLGTEDVSGSQETGTTPNASHMTHDGAPLGLGTIGRRGATAPKDTPILRHKIGGVGVMGISPAQHLLFVHTPPREIPLRSWDRNADVERAISPERLGRRRTMSWYGSDGQRGGNRAGTRGSSTTGRPRNGSGKVGSLEEHLM
ncbi:hypothetical protein M413DRAFT_441076 [Hebeloma cylindrosporum]|uniref:Uncharacterized protein n=1 Tax=Hebeloma cylindrosporum TaxID=76867 RepID=A0A0C3CPH1_HEBCY|nr:hypothetical protein M413DRAFT_441076 [Hebeloma cylindrosporum h7]